MCKSFPRDVRPEIATTVLYPEVEILPSVLADQ